MRPRRTFNPLLFGVCACLAALSVFSRVALRAQSNEKSSGAIVFASSRGGNSEIYIMNADG